MDIGIGQQRIVDAHRLTLEVDAMTLHRKSAGGAFHTRLLDEVGGVEAHVVEVEGIDLHPILEERQQLNVDDEATHIGHSVSQLRQRVVLLQDAQPLHAEVERKGQVDVLYGDVHARLLAGHACHFLHGPVLHGGDIQRSCQHGDKHHGQQNDDGYPLQHFLHIF